jgi:GNAT superfamily N-acetyltransferase
MSGEREPPQGDEGKEIPLSAVENLTKQHVLSDFSCDNDDPERDRILNQWLKKYALINQANSSCRVYVVHRRLRVAGYYSIAPGSVAIQDAPKRVAAGLAKHPVPVVLIARLAVDLREAGKGLGAALLKDALLRSAAAADAIGGRAVLVHAIDARARDWYTKFGFEPSSTDDLHLMLLMKDIRANF